MSYFSGNPSTTTSTCLNFTLSATLVEIASALLIACPKISYPTKLEFGKVCANLISALSLPQPTSATREPYSSLV